MPKVSEFKEKAKKKPQKPVDPVEMETSAEEESEVELPAERAKSRRRPGNIHHTQEMKETKATQEEETMQTEIQFETSTDHQTTGTETASSINKDGVEKLEFYGSDLLKEHAPQLHRSLEIIVQDWKQDGRFEGLPVGHPLLQALASVGLQRAKKVEKKLDEKGVFMMARMGADIVKMKLNELRGKKDSNE